MAPPCVTFWTDDTVGLDLENCAVCIWRGDEDGTVGLVCSCTGEDDCKMPEEGLTWMDEGETGVCTDIGEDTCDGLEA